MKYEVQTYTYEELACILQANIAYYRQWNCVS